MSRSGARPWVLVATALAAIAPTMWQRHVACVMTMVPVACGPLALLWSLACDTLLAVALCLLALALRRALGSVRRQRMWTAEALRPLLALPPVTTPPDLASPLRALRLEGRTTLIACATPVALCHGLLRPRLLLSTGALRGLSVAEVEAVLRHERAHLRRRDPLRLVVARALAAALPAVPSLGELAAALPSAQELAADRAVLSAMGADALARALLKVSDAGGAPRGPMVAIGAFSAQVLADARIDQLLGAPVPRLSPSPRTLLQPTATLGLVVVLAALFPLVWCIVLALVTMGLLRAARPRMVTPDEIMGPVV